MAGTGIGAGVSTAPNHPNLSVHRREGEPRPRRFLVMHGPRACTKMTGFNRDIDTLERAVKERVFFVKTHDGFMPTPQPSIDIPASLTSYVEALRPNLPSTAPLHPHQFVETFTGRKRAMYERVLYTKWHEGICAMDAQITPFVKYEKVDLNLKADPVPRVVSPRKPKYNIALGRFLRPIEEEIFKAIGFAFGGKTVMKGYDAFTQASIIREAWEEFTDPVAFGLDASRFDQHVSRDMLKWEHSVYLECFPCKSDKIELAMLLNMQLDNVCEASLPDGTLRYTTNGVRMSGDMNTSLGACLIMCGVVYAYQPGCRYRLINNGDDCVIITERSDLCKFDNISTHFSKHGFTLVREEVVDVFEKIEFCQTQPILTSGGWFMCRKPQALMSKDHVCLQYRSSKEFKVWLRSIGSVRGVFTGVPCHGRVYNAFYNHGAEGKTRKDDTTWSFKHLYQKTNKTTGVISDSTRYSYYLAFGILPEEQVAIEQAYDSIEWGESGGFDLPGIS